MSYTESRFVLATARAVRAGSAEKKDYREFIRIEELSAGLR